MSLGVRVWKSFQEWSVQRSAVRSIAWLGALRGSRMDMIWRLFDTNDVRNWIRVRTAVDLNVIQIAAGVCEQDDLKCAIGICKLEI